MADGILKTMPNTGTYFPPKIMVDGQWRYIVGITQWHDHEHDAREAHRLRALLAQAEEVLEQASDYLHDIPESDVGGDDEGTRVAGVVRRALAAVREGRP